MQPADNASLITPFYVMELLARAKALENQGRDIVHMEIGEPDFSAPEAVVEAGVRAMRAGQVKYTAAAGLPELRSALARYYGEHYGVDLPERRIFIAPGASGALLLALAASLNAGDEVLLADPGYPCYRNFVRLFGAEPVSVATRASDGHRLGWPQLRAAWSGRTAGAIVASPANPTGVVLDEPTLGELCEGVAGQGGFLVSDEIYHGLEYGPRCPTALQFGSQAFVINSFSKYFCMTGWRLGWLVAPDSHVETVERLAQNLFISAPTHSQYAAVAALADPQARAELEQRRLEFQRRRDYLQQALARLGFGLSAPPEGAFYVYADCSRFTQDSDAFARDLLEQAGVAITPGRDFGETAASRHVRFAYTTSLERLEEGVKRMERYLAGVSRDSAAPGF
ncbi:aminotransferase [Methylogaea oryzae]|uniref:Aminotransferase n=3 Tax=Methylogaea oryzae TaxID=1295382 RepID=A0A8D4VQN2_9GAMM|nr:aminotransferase [Methylogaea oryzae]